jgi:hypothetical protein
MSALRDGMVTVTQLLILNYAFGVLSGLMLAYGIGVWAIWYKKRKMN